MRLLLGKRPCVWRFLNVLAQFFSLLCILLPILSVIFFPGMAAADMVVDSKNVAMAPKLEQTNTGITQINIVNPQGSLSHNQFEQFNVGSKGVVINNSPYSKPVRGFGVINANTQLSKPAETILFEVTGESRSELQGTVTVAGDQVSFILINPNGITCNGCSFANISGGDVSLRTDKLRSIDDGVASWYKDLNGEINIGEHGIAVRDGSLVLSSGKIKFEGGISVKETLRAEAHLTDDKKLGVGGKDETRKYAINVSTAALITAGKVYLIATEEGVGVRLAASKLFASEGDAQSKDAIRINEKRAYIEAKKGSVFIEEISVGPEADVAIYGKKVDIKNISGVQNLVIHGHEIVGDFKLNNIKNIEIADKISMPHSGTTTRVVDFNITTTINIDSDFKFIGRNFKNQGALKAKNIKLDLSGNFINEENGSIVATGFFCSAEKGFANHHRIDVDESFQVIGSSFVNDKGGEIGASSIKIHATEKMKDGNSLYQGSNSVLESKKGGMELIAPKGGIYFGYKKELTGEGDNKDSFKFIGSQLLSYGGTIQIQSGGNVEFDGAQLAGDVVVAAKGEIKENNLTGSYKSGMHDVYGNVAKIRTVMKSEQRTRNVSEDVIKTRIVNKPVTKTREVFDHTETWCPSGISIFGGCVGGPEHKDHYRTESYIEQIPTEESYTETVTRQVTETVQIPVQEEYTVYEVIGQEPSFQEVSLKVNFAGNKRFFANTENLIFKAAEYELLYHGSADDIKPLEFFSSSQLADKNEKERYNLHNEL